MRLEDNKGTSWKVEARDPASKHINQLKRRGFEYVVLPRLTYMTGTLVDESSEDFVRGVRLADCLMILRDDA